jgi:hypothetical protein
MPLCLYGSTESNKLVDCGCARVKGETKRENDAFTFERKKKTETAFIHPPSSLSSFPFFLFLLAPIVSTTTTIPTPTSTRLTRHTTPRFAYRESTPHSRSRVSASTLSCIPATNRLHTTRPILIPHTPHEPSHTTPPCHTRKPRTRTRLVAGTMRMPARPTMADTLTSLRAGAMGTAMETEGGTAMVTEVMGVERMLVSYFGMLRCAGRRSREYEGGRISSMLFRVVHESS